MHEVRGGRGDNVGGDRVGTNRDILRRQHRIRAFGPVADDETKAPVLPLGAGQRLDLHHLNDETLCTHGRSSAVVAIVKWAGGQVVTVAVSGRRR